MMEEPLVETHHQVLMNQAPMIEINGVLPRVEKLSSFLKRNLHVGVEKIIVIETLSIPQAIMILTRKTTSFKSPYFYSNMKGFHE